MQFLYSYCFLSLLKCVFVGSTDIADPHATTPSLRLVNKASLDRILQAEVYINESDGQLRATHLILGYTPISRAFQAPRCMIRARDPWFHRISVAYEGFVVPQSIPLPRYSPLMEPLPVATLAARATSSPLPPPRFCKWRRKRNQNKRKRVLWTLLCPPTITKFLINPHHHKTCLKIWVFKGNPSVVFKSCWKTNQEWGKLGSLLNPHFLLLHLNLLLALLSHLHPPRSNKLILRGEWNQRARR